MPLEVLQCATWYGEPRELGDLFRLTKNRRQARAVIYSHQFGWELRLFIGRQADPVQTQVCRTQDDVLTTGETWKAAMIEKDGPDDDDG